MKKKIVALLLTLVMLLGVIPAAVYAANGYDSTNPAATYIFEADKTTVTAGDTITYTLKLEWAEALLNAGQTAYIDIPEGMSYVAKSGKVDPGAQAALGYDSFTWSENPELTALVIGGYGLGTAMPATGAVTLCTFQVTVDEDATAGNYAVNVSSDPDVYDSDFVDAEYNSYSMTAGDVVSETADVTVVIYVTGIELSATELELTKAAPEATLTATVKPAAATNKEVTWSSDNEAVATVDADGNVTRVGEGTANITATSKENADITATCVVTVIHECGAETLTAVDAKDADCYTAGNIAYYECSCGKLYADDAAATETTLEAVTVAALDHPAAEVTATAAVDATHTTAGNIAYWTCALCGDKFSDEACDTKVEDVTVPALGHDNADDLDWTITADEHQKVCSCGVILSNEAHTYEWVEDTAATCTAEGVKHEECTVCGAKRNEGTAIEMIAHATTKTDAVAPTCTDEGNIDYWTCSECGKIFSDAACTTEITLADTVVAENGHTDGEWKNTTAPTCTKKGEDTLYCAVCEVALQTREVAALTHDFAGTVTAPTCTEAGYTTYKCTRNCGEEGATYVANEVAATGHSMPAEEDWVESDSQKGLFLAYCENGCGTILDEELRTTYIKWLKLDQHYVYTSYVRGEPAFTLTAIVSPDVENLEEYEIVWSSSNEEVATVDQDGNVTTHKRGDCDITATIVGAEETFTASCHVTVRYTFCQCLIWLFLFGCFWYFI